MIERSILHRGSDSSEALLTSYKLQKGAYSRVAKALRVDPSYVSRVVSGDRKSDKIKRAVLLELSRVHSSGKGKLNCPICADSAVTALANRIEISGLASGNNKDLSKPLAAFRCAAWHTFFVPRSDLRSAKVHPASIRVNGRR